MVSPSDRYYEYALVALGLVLLLNPLYVGGLALDEPNWHRYETARVEYGDGGLEFYDGDRNLTWIDGGVDGDVACLDRRFRVCRLEHHVHEENVSYPEVMAAGPGEGYRYAYIDDRFYRVQPQTMGGSGTLGHEPISAEKAMGYISASVEDVSPAVRDAVTSGSVETHHALDGANELVAHDGDHYVVYEAAYSVYGGDAYDRKKLEGQLVEGALTLAGVAAGLWLILRGQRRRVRRQVVSSIRRRS